jgi:hypothetical protein
MRISQRKQTAPISRTRVIADVQAYRDTVEIFFPYRPKGLLATIKSGAKRAWFKNCFDDTGAIVGCRLVLQKPTLQIFPSLEFWREKHKGKICRLDIAFDFRCRPGTDKQSLICLIEKQMVLKWSPCSWMIKIETTRYWVEQFSRKRRSNRDLCFYPNRPSKLDQSPDCIHLELKLFRTEVVKREGVNTFFDLIKLDPARLFKKHVRCVDYNFIAFERAFVRSAVRDDIRRHRNRTHSSVHVEQYRTHVRQRARGFLRRYELDHAQNLKRLYPKRVQKMSSLRVEDLFQLPSALSWN